MDSSEFNPSYGQWNVPYSSHPPPAHILPPPPPPHPESSNFCGRLSQSNCQLQDYHHYSHHQNLPLEPAVNQPSSYFSHHLPPVPQQHPPYVPQKVSYETQRISQLLSPTIPCTESRDIPQSAWVGYKEKRHDFWTVDAGQDRMDVGRNRVDAGLDPNYQYDYGRSSRDSLSVSINRGLCGTSKSRDEFHSLGYKRKEPGTTRIEGNYQDRGQLRSESGRYFRGLNKGNRVLSPSVGYGRDRYGVTVSPDVTRSSESYEVCGGRTLYPRKKDHSEIEQYFDRGRREVSNESNRTPKKQMQRKSALLRLETPRSYQNGSENDCSRHHSQYSGKRFNSNSCKGKQHLGRSDRGLVQRQRGRSSVDLDVSFKSNVLVAKHVASPTTAGIRSGMSCTPRSSKARRALVTDKNEKASITGRNRKLTPSFSDGASVSEGSRLSTRPKTASDIKKKPDRHSNPHSSDSRGKLNKVKFVEGVDQVKSTDTGLEASTHDSEVKVHSTVHAAEKISSFCEALEEAKNEVNVEYDSNMEACSAEEDVNDGDKSILKFQKDVLDRKVTGCNAGEALMLKVMEKEEIVKTPVSWPIPTDLLGCSEEEIHFAGKSMCSVGSQPCEDEDMDCIPSLMMEVNTGSEERKSIGSSVESLGYGENDFEKSSLNASIYCHRENPGDQVLAKSDIDVIEGDNNGINKNVDSLSPANNSPMGHSKALVSSASLDVANVSMDLANANSRVSGIIADAKSFTVGIYTNTIVKSPDMNVVVQVESKNRPHCGNTFNPSVENFSRKEFTETKPINSAAEMADNLDSDEGNRTCVNGTSSSLTKFDVKGSSNVLPMERTDGCSRSDELDLAMAVSSDVCMENVSNTERLSFDEDLSLASHRPAEIPSVDQSSGSDSGGLKALLSEPNDSLSKIVVDGPSECLVERDVSQIASSFCNKLPSSSAFVIETNLAIGGNGMSGSETVTDAESGLHETHPCSTVCKLLPEDRFECGSSGAIGSFSMDKNLENDPSRFSSSLVSNRSVSPCHISPSVAVNEQLPNKTSIQVNYSGSHDGIMHEEYNCVENIEVYTQEEKEKSSVGTSKYRTPGTDIIAVSGDSVFPCDSLSSSPRRSFRQIRSEIHVAAMVDEASKVGHKGDILFDTLQEQIMTSHVTQPGSSLAQYPCLGQKSTCTDVDSCDHPMSKYPGSNLVEKPNDDPVEKLTDLTSDESPGGSGIRMSRSHSHADAKFALTHVKDHVVSAPHRDYQSKTSLSSRYEIEKKKKKSYYSTQKSHPRSLSIVYDTKKDANLPTHITKRHTWHRKSDTSPSSFVAANKPLSSNLSTHQKFTKVTAQSSSSYIRKGNSLLRKPSHGSPGVALGMTPSTIPLTCFTAKDKSTGSSSMVDVDNSFFLVETGERLALEKQSTPPSDSSTSKLSNALTTSSQKCALSFSVEHLTNGLPESIMDSATSGEANAQHSGVDTLKTSGMLIHTGSDLDCQQKKNPPKLDSSNLKRMVYVKRKANQLVAASDILGASKMQIHVSDCYFKRSKNQLVRNSETRVNQSISLPNDALDSRAVANMFSESSSSAFSDSAVMRPFKQSKFSLVWTQNDPHPRMPIANVRYQKILPQLVPWKRVTYWRRFVNSVSPFRNGSFSNISRKLSMIRKRHTVYTRSNNGYSLRKSKVLSAGGSHLKWSKSIERDSRKANEETTLAVPPTAKKESQKNPGQSNTRTTSRNHLNHKDVDSPCSAPSENGKCAKRPFIPKRSVIGSEEYVRVGNGNQLVRDPKKRTRVLANEKVRWSLHNVRLRLAKKKKYCQFFTRFGKCNKDDGKCLYVHDPSKIAVCSNFLNGMCANANCKLTHKVIPERMPDCSYFLQGLCNNETCPYRHVHVNPSTAICDGFLKGYCSDGDECRKKHSYICPVYEATGSCSQGSKCKLHHPKNQSKGKKRKRPSEPSQKNARGRYFGSLHKVVSESEPMVIDRSSTNSEVFGMEGLDFIILGATEYEDPTTEQSISSDSEPPVSIYNLIRPVALMQ